MRFTGRLSSVMVIMTASLPAMAYIGPGSGISVIGSLLGLLATLLIAVGAIALFPIRKMMKRRSEESHPEKDEDVTDVEPGNPSPEPARKEGLNTE